MSKGFSVMSVLNDKSKSIREKSPALVELISVHKLVANENNFYDTSDIDGLKDNIELFGLKQNLVVVRADDDTYRVIAGHRRMMALRALVDEGKSEFELVPCRVEDGDIDKVEEEMLLIYTNSTARQLSDGEKVKQFERMQELIPEYKKTHDLPGRKREILASLLNVSPATVGRLEQVSKNLVPEFKEELEQEKISMQTAVELSKLDKDTQQKVHKEHKERGSTKKKDVEQFKELRDKAEDAFGMPKKIKQNSDYKEEAADKEEGTLNDAEQVTEDIGDEDTGLVIDETESYLEALDEVISYVDVLADINEPCMMAAYKKIVDLLKAEREKG